MAPVIRTGSPSAAEFDVVGVRLQSGLMSGRVMLFGGGWADFEFSAGYGTDVVLELHRLTNDCVDGLLTRLLDRLIWCFENVGAAESPS